MFNPLYPFTKPLLDSFIKAGKHYFVRNIYAPDKSNVTRPSFLISHYDDISKAKAHFNSIQTDPYRYLYYWNNGNDQTKLLNAASQPAGYKIYSAVFKTDWKKEVTSELKNKINKYMYSHTDWRPGSGDTTHLNFYFQFGQLYFTLMYGGNKITGKFDDLEI